MGQIFKIVVNSKAFENGPVQEWSSYLKLTML